MMVDEWTEPSLLEISESWMVPRKTGLFKLGTFNGKVFECFYMNYADKPFTLCDHINYINSNINNKTMILHLHGKEERTNMEKKLLTIHKCIEERKGDKIYVNWLVTDMPKDQFESMIYDQQSSDMYKWDYDLEFENKYEHVDTYVKYIRRSCFKLFCCCFYGCQQYEKIETCGVCDLPLEDYHYIKNGKYVCYDSKQ